MGCDSKTARSYSTGKIISNADILQTLNKLLSESDLPSRLAHAASSIRPANSAFMLYLALDVDMPMASSTFIMRGSERGHHVLSSVPGRPGPPGYSTLTLTGLVGAGDVDKWDRRSPYYRQMKREAGDRLIGLSLGARPRPRGPYRLSRRREPCDLAPFLLDLRRLRLRCHSHYPLAKPRHADRRPVRCRRLNRIGTGNRGGDGRRSVLGRTNQISAPGSLPNRGPIIRRC